MSTPEPLTGTRDLTIVLGNDHTLFREGMKAMLSGVPVFKVVAEAATGEAAVELTAEFQPDVLVLSAEMPVLRTASVVKEVRRLSPHTRVIVLSMHDHADLVYDMLNSGVAAFLSTTSTRTELVAAIGSVQQPGNVMLSVSRETIEHLDSRRDSALPSPLTDRERQILGLTALALTNLQIGSRLYIAEATVKRHLTSIYAKLGAVSRVDAIRKATAMNLIKASPQSPDDPAAEARAESSALMTVRVSSSGMRGDWMSPARRQRATSSA